MDRTCLQLKSGLRAVALAAILGGQSGCMRATPVISGPNLPAFANASSTARSSASARASTPGSGEGSRVVIRDYWMSPRSFVVAWNPEENWQGLRGAVRRDGSIRFDHLLYFSVYSAPNPRAFAGANWYAFADAGGAGVRLQPYGTHADINSCQGTKGCTPYITYQARVPDEVLRRSRDSLVIKVVSYDGCLTDIALSGELIASYLATVDSVSSARKLKAASNH